MTCQRSQVTGQLSTLKSKEVKGAPRRGTSSRSVGRGGAETAQQVRRTQLQPEELPTVEHALERGDRPSADTGEFASTCRLQPRTSGKSYKKGQRLGKRQGVASQWCGPEGGRSHRCGKGVEAPRGPDSTEDESLKPLGRDSKPCLPRTQGTTRWGLEQGKCTNPLLPRWGREPSGSRYH